MTLSRNQQMALGGAVVLVILIVIGAFVMIGPSAPEVEGPDGEQAGAAAARGGAGAEPGALASDDDPHTIVFIVMDTLRAENTNLCGYARPNTPTLNRLREEGAAVSCDAHSPAFWTLPSHASYFTGLPVVEHGLLPLGVKLPDDLPTLAEDMTARGYRTALVSGNPLLNKITGLQRGFEIAHVRPRQVRGPPIVKAVRQVLKSVKPNEKLFLFVNIFDAHDPYPAIPEGVGWVEPQDGLALYNEPPNWMEPLATYTDFTKGVMPEGEKVDLQKKVRNGYDYGIFKADQVLGGVLGALVASPRAKRPYRLAVTSDHGEFLGEHERLRHMCCVYEPVTRVPLLFKDSSLDEQPDLSGPTSALWVHSLVSHGRLPDDAGTPTAVGYSRNRDRSQVAMWNTTTDKVVADNQELLHYDLAADPGELNPQPLGDHPLKPELTELSERVTDKFADAQDVDPEMAALLEAMGYVDPE